jgi:hypothetical protein
VSRIEFGCDPEEGDLGVLTDERGSDLLMLSWPVARSFQHAANRLVRRAVRETRRAPHPDSDAAAELLVALEHCVLTMQRFMPRTATLDGSATAEERATALLAKYGVEVES